MMHALQVTNLHPIRKCKIEMDHIYSEFMHNLDLYSFIVTRQLPINVVASPQEIQEQSKDTYNNIEAWKALECPQDRQIYNKMQSNSLELHPVKGKEEKKKSPNLLSVALCCSCLCSIMPI